MAFGERLCEIRKSRGLTQEQLANMVGVAKSTLTGYEKNNREPNVITITKLAAALGVTGNELLGIASRPSPMLLTEFEQKVICAYRDNPEMQAAVHKLLGIQDNDAKVYQIAARDGQKKVELTREQREEMAKSVERAKDDDISDLV